MEFGKLFKIHQLFKKEGVDIKHLVFGEIKTADGANTLTYQGEDIMVGEPVFILTDEGEIPAPDGEHSLEDGRVILIEGGLGVVSDIKEAAVEGEPATEGEPAPVVESEPTPLSKEEVERTITERVRKFEDETNKKFDEKVVQIEAKFKAESEKYMEIIEGMATLFNKQKEAPAVKPAQPVKKEFAKAKETEFDTWYKKLKN